MILPTFAALVLSILGVPLTIYFLIWYQQARYLQFVFAMKVFNNSMFYYITIVSGIVIIIGYYAHFGKPSKRRGAYLLTWLISLFVLGLVYAMHGYELSEDLHKMTGDAIIAAVQDIKQGSKLGKVAAAGMKVAKTIAFLIAESTLPDPYGTWFYFANRPHILIVWGGVAPVIGCGFLAILVNAERVNNNLLVEKENRDLENQPVLVD